MEHTLQEMLESGPIVINIGIDDFVDTLRQQGAMVVGIEWTPPAGGDQEMLDILDQLL